MVEPLRNLQWFSHILALSTTSAAQNANLQSTGDNAAVSEEVTGDDEDSAAEFSSLVLMSTTRNYRMILGMKQRGWRRGTISQSGSDSDGTEPDDSSVVGLPGEIFYVHVCLYFLASQTCFLFLKTNFIDNNNNEQCSWQFIAVANVNITRQWPYGWRYHCCRLHWPWDRKLLCLLDSRSASCCVSYKASPQWWRLMTCWRFV